MKCKKNGYFVVLLINIAVIFPSTLSYTIPDINFEIISPKGFRAWIPAEDDVKLFGFHGALNHELIGTAQGDFEGDITKPKDGKFIYENTNINLNQGDEIHYWIFVQNKGSGFYSKNKKFKIGTSTTIIGTPSTGNNCQPSVTRVRGRSVCQGELIFEDQFNILNWTQWKRDIRIPLDTDDADFVSFQDRSENCYISDGILYIVPNLLTEIPGYDESSIRNGLLSLGSKCTGIVNKQQECERQAGGYIILPPVVSAKIHTKEYFSFVYGTIEVRAKLAKGDWLFPQIFLEPYTHQYGITGFASGQLRVAFIRGNNRLRDKNNYQLDGHRLFGGAVLTTGDRYRDQWLQNTLRPEHLGDSFHIYRLKWTEDSITMSIDGQEYGSISGGFGAVHKSHNINHAAQWQNGGYMAPFDQEFYISLGVSAGGISDFPDGCRTGEDGKTKPWGNASPKAELKFFTSSSDWYSTWKGQESGMQVDYVKVWAL